jgi:exportin-1
LIAFIAVCLEVINNFSDADPNISNNFFQAYFMSIIQDIFFVLTDTDQKSGFQLQSLLLARMFQLVESNMIQTPLFNAAEMADPAITNAQYVRQYCENLLKAAFPHVRA